MAELKTTPNDMNVNDFLNKIQETKKREDSFKILELMKEVTGEEPRMWGPSIVGFGNYQYRYSSGREGVWMKTGFSPRKQNLTIYIMNGVNTFENTIKKLGKCKTSGSCIYIKKLDDIDLEVLRDLLAKSMVSPMIGQVPD